MNDAFRNLASGFHDLQEDDKSWTLTIDVDQSEARLEDGVLTLKVAKVQSAMARQIQVD